MRLSLRDAATLLSRSERTMRAQLARGELRAVKVGGAWQIDSSDLPMTDAQRQRMSQRADRARDLDDRALPRAARRQSSRSMRDLKPFDAAVALLSEARTAQDLDACVSRGLERGLAALAEAAHEFDFAARADALRRARTAWARAAAFAWPSAQDVTDRDAPLAARIEAQLIARVGGLLRWTEDKRDRAVSGAGRDRWRAS